MCSKCIQMIKIWNACTFAIFMASARLHGCVYNTHIVQKTMVRGLSVHEKCNVHEYKVQTNITTGSNWNLNWYGINEICVRLCAKSINREQFAGNVSRINTLYRWKYQVKGMRILQVSIYSIANYSMQYIRISNLFMTAYGAYGVFLSIWNHDRLKSNDSKIKHYWMWWKRFNRNISGRLPCCKRKLE